MHILISPLPQSQIIHARTVHNRLPYAGGERIEDCIALALGGNENYDQTLAEHQDVTLFMTPMWASKWKAMGQEAASGKRRDLGAMLKGTGMTKVARIDTGLCFETEFIEKVDGFAREFGLERIELPGGTVVAKGCYERAKSRMDLIEVTMGWVVARLQWGYSIPPIGGQIIASLKEPIFVVD